MGAIPVIFVHNFDPLGRVQVNRPERSRRIVGAGRLELLSMADALTVSGGFRTTEEGHALASIHVLPRAGSARPW